MGTGRLLTATLLAFVATVAGHVPARAAPPPANARRAAISELARIAAESGGTLGVSALNLESGERLQLNADKRYPMASVFKVPVALQLLDLVDHGDLRLDETVEIDAANLSPGSGELKKTSEGTARSATLAELLGTMLRDSDNTAADILLDRAGGPAAVTLHLRKLGVDEIDVSRPAAQLVADAWGFKLPAPGKRTSDAIAAAQRAVPARARAAAAKAFLADARDTATPDATVALLERIQGGRALGPDSTRILIGEMEKCRTGTGRIKAGLPRGTALAHKTGTLTRVTTNDVGIVTLPDGRGRIALAVFLRGSARTLAEQERALAAAARVAYRYFTR